ncbi:MAG: hypothetical protein WDN47_02860 [Candidatus Doudnabacteria bacterium]
MKMVYGGKCLTLAEIEVFCGVRTFDDATGFSMQDNARILVHLNGDDRAKPCAGCNIRRRKVQNELDSQPVKR